MFDVLESANIEHMKKFLIEPVEMPSPTKQVRERQKQLEKVRKESEQKRIAREVAALKHEDNKWWIDKIQWAIGIGVAVLIGWEPLSKLFAYLNL